MHEKVNEAKGNNRATFKDKTVFTSLLSENLNQTAGKMKAKALSL